MLTHLHKAARPHGDPTEARTPISTLKGWCPMPVRRWDHLLFIKITRVFHSIIPSLDFCQFIRLNLGSEIVKHISYLSSFILHKYYNIFFYKNQERFLGEDNASLILLNNLLVGDTGLEPARPQRQEFLRLPRIPIPTIPHVSRF